MSFSFFKADPTYCDYLRRTDPCVPYTMDRKSSRPFVGVIIKINAINYYAPLTSPKPKHLTMKNQVDFLKIKDGTYGAININNMIPIHYNDLSKIDMAPLLTDSKEDIAYKNLLSNQLSWCNSHSDEITLKATKLYNIITLGKGRPDLVKRCCNFIEDEKQYEVYLSALPEVFSHL